MSYSKRQANASRNIREVKGWVCPTCESLVPRGYEVCYNCGDMPPLYSSGGGSSSDDGSTLVYCLEKIIICVAVFFAPLFFIFAMDTEELTSGEIMFTHVTLFIPNLIFLLTAYFTFKKRKFLFKYSKFPSGCLFTLNRLWVMFFSFWSILIALKFFFIK